MPFVPRLVSALDDGEVQSKLADAVLMPLINPLMEAFGQAVGDKVGTMLAEHKRHFEQKLLKLKIGIDTESERTHATVDFVSRAATSEAAAGESCPGDKLNTSKNCCRRERRKRNRDEHVVERISLLRARPELSSSNAIRINLDQPLILDDLMLRICNLEIALTLGMQLGTCETVESNVVGIPAEFLEKQCTAARILQLWWRRHIQTAGPHPTESKYDPRVADQIDHFIEDVFDQRLSLYLAVPEDDIKQNVVGEELDRLLDDVISADIESIPGRASSEVEPPAVANSLDGNASTHAIEQRIANAIAATDSFKNLSGEPWRAVSDIVGLHTAARHFAAIAKEVPYWDLDDLGRVLGIRDRILSMTDCP